MAQNNTIGTKLKFQDLPDVPDNQKLTATEFNQLPTFQKSPVQQIAGSLDDTDIVIDGTKNYGTTIVVAGATRTITANASGHSQGNNIKQRYQFNVDCTLTLIGFDTIGNNTGTTSPIPSGTYDFQFISNRNGVNLNIPQNTEAQDISDKLDKVDPADQTVASDVEFAQNVNVIGDFQESGTNISEIYSPISTVSSQWTTAGSDIIYDIGNVIIGTDTPASGRLQVVGGNIRVSNTIDVGLKIRHASAGADFNIFQESDGDLAIKFGATDLFHIEIGGNTGFNETNPVAKVDINQPSGTAAIPVLKLTQADVSEEMIEFDPTTIGIGDPIEAIGAKSFTQTHFMKVFVVGLGVKYMPIGDLS